MTIEREVIGDNDLLDFPTIIFSNKLKTWRYRRDDDDDDRVVRKYNIYVYSVGENKIWYVLLHLIASKRQRFIKFVSTKIRSVLQSCLQRVVFGFIEIRYRMLVKTYSLRTCISVDLLEMSSYSHNISVATVLLNSPLPRFSEHFYTISKIVPHKKKSIQSTYNIIT